MRPSATADMHLTLTNASAKTTKLYVQALYKVDTILAPLQNARNASIPTAPRREAVLLSEHASNPTPTTSK
jgi:hypothetical protein